MISIQIKGKFGQIITKGSKNSKQLSWKFKLSNKFIKLFIVN